MNILFCFSKSCLCCRSSSGNLGVNKKSQDQIANIAVLLHTYADVSAFTFSVQDTVCLSQLTLKGTGVIPQSISGICWFSHIFHYSQCSVICSDRQQLGYWLENRVTGSEPTNRKLAVLGPVYTTICRVKMQNFSCILAVCLHVYGFRGSWKKTKHCRLLAWHYYSVSGVPVASYAPRMYLKRCCLHVELFLNGNWKQNGNLR